MRRRIAAPNNQVRNAVPQMDNSPSNLREEVDQTYTAPRKNDAAYQAYLKRGANSRNGKVTATESGAKGMANQGEIDRLKHLIKSARKKEI